MDSQLYNLKRKITHYKEVLKNSENYRKVWKTELKNLIIQNLEKIILASELEAQIDEASQLENLEAVMLNLGEVRSGMYQQVNEDFQRHLIKNNGSLIYQQLFNGKVIVLVQYPFIENFVKQRPPKTIGIYRPEELTEPFFLRHFEEFIQEISNWEDYDDDEPHQKIGFHLNFPSVRNEEESLEE